MGNQSQPSANRVLKGEHVYLRPPTIQELGYVERIWSDPETMEAVGGPVTGFQGERAAQWFARMVDPGCDTDCYFLIFTGDNEPVGEVSYHKLNRETMRAMLNIKVMAQARHKGYGRDALLTFLRYFFEEVGGKAILDDIALDNRVAQEMLLRVGFEQDHEVTGAFMAFMTREKFEELYGQAH